ncbi:MAG: hypothetical protein Q7T10_16465 [Rhodoferax sp.]|uniref:hypothetical protein n=1 Tax=Rhodoferax sp. TaxID=50421 RepID=UPI002715CE76|nr:hypothetical protein [Rhodoferax sp.]MDO8450392.1 hypothetical protein [Rhodoferax sp.]
MTTPHSADQSSISLYDARPFFEKALVFGVQNGILDQQKLDAICTDAPKGMVQIARYFGSEFLRPELEKAKDRIVNLVSLYLESTSKGDLRQAAESLRDHSFLSRSKGGSDMLKGMIAMPQNSHFGMNEHGGFTDDHIPLLARWSLRSLADYQAEFAKRSEVAQIIDAAIWLADTLGMDTAELEDAGKDAEAVIRTALLVLATKRTEMPDWVAFEKMIAALRKKHGSAPAVVKGTSKAANKASAGPAVFAVTIPKNLPDQFKAVVEAVRQSVVADLPKILDATLPTRKLFDQTPAFMGRYFWVEDSLSEVDHHDRSASDTWNKATGGHSDDSSLLTLFLSVAAGVAPKTLLTEKGAAALIRKIRKAGLKQDLVNQYILNQAPAQHQEDYSQLWINFMDDAQNTLQSDFDYELKDALALLRRECNVK